MAPFPIDYSDEWDSKTTQKTIIVYDTVFTKMDKGKTQDDT